MSCLCGHDRNKHMHSWDRKIWGACVECDCIKYSTTKVWSLREVEKLYK